MKNLNLTQIITIGAGTFLACTFLLKRKKKTVLSPVAITPEKTDELTEGEAIDAALIQEAAAFSGKIKRSENKDFSGIVRSAGHFDKILVDSDPKLRYSSVDGWDSDVISFGS